ncbi:hypothetical protein [Mycobacterium sp.]|uniref:hypothetical protein n=1 Tax=Mycobacterium sp. TaxID=1785 RepID=UPI0031DA6A73
MSRVAVVAGRTRFEAAPTTAGGSDLAEVLYTHGTTVATGAPNLYDILTAFGGDYTNVPAAAASAAADSSSLWTDLASLF